MVEEMVGTQRKQNMLLLQNCHQKDSQNINDTVLAPKG